MISIKRSFISVFITLTLFTGFALSPFFVAQAFTDEQITKQEAVVKSQLLATMEEHLKLLQMMLIQRLEQQIAELTAAQNK